MFIHNDQIALRITALSLTGRIYYYVLEIYLFHIKTSQVWELLSYYTLYSVQHKLSAASRGNENEVLTFTIRLYKRKNHKRVYDQIVKLYGNLFLLKKNTCHSENNSYDLYFSDRYLGHPFFGFR